MMSTIPKKIHFAWFSGDPFTDEVQRCMESWRRFLPDYEWVKWDYESVREIDNLFLQQALQEKKWAFAADFIRAYAVYHFGGIYLDTDVLLFRNFEDFLADECFIGQEPSFHIEQTEPCSFLTSHCFGAKPGNEFVALCLEYYRERPFILNTSGKLPQELKFDMKLMSQIQAEIAKSLGYDWRYRIKVKQNLDELTIYPSEYFDAAKVKSNTVAQHLAMGNWRNNKRNYRKVNMAYKIQWRIISLFDKLLRRFNYKILDIH